VSASDPLAGEIRLERRVSFDPVAETYDRVRHSYPPEVFADLQKYLLEGRPSALSPQVLEIGPGTGKATQGLLDAGAQVTGIEIGPVMAAFVANKYAGIDTFRVIQSSFEAVDLPPGSFDVVVAATAFHWVDPAIRVAKAVELLAPGGVLAAIATVQVQSDVDRGYFARSEPIYRKYGEADDSGYVAPDRAAAVAPEYGEFASSSLLVDAAYRRYDWDQRYTTAEYADLMRSYSNMQMMEPAAREALIAELSLLIESEFEGYVVRPLVIGLSMARRRD
jgi:SAM-dependent methyltransferase